MEQRIKALKILVNIVFVALLGILIFRMFFYDDNIKELSSQYYRVVDTIYPRGNITDRNGISFNSANAEHFESVKKYSRYSSVASQIIGTTEINPDDTTSESFKGTSGLNYIFDELLNGGTPVNVSAMYDANGNILTDYGAIISGEHINEGCNITLSLDYNIQSSFEKIMEVFSNERSYKSMCAILTDSSTGEIISMATVGSEMNMNVLSFQPGSVMKIITAACAFEEGIIKPDDLFECKGTFKVGEETRSCSGGEIHGKITMKEAFAQSCNQWAYETNQKLIYKEDGVIKSKMLDMAHKWGFAYEGYGEDEFVLSYDGYYSFIPESLYNEMDIFNSALGQGNIQSTVYLINKVTSAIANGGKSVKPYIISSITDPIGNYVYDVKNDWEVFDLGLKDETVKALNECMRQCCITGSANHITVENAAGKTGTAEHIPGEECHSWFTGYFPVNDRNYALTVFVANGGNAPRSAVVLFDLLANEAKGMMEK